MWFVIYLLQSRILDAGKQNKVIATKLFLLLENTARIKLISILQKEQHPSFWVLYSNVEAIPCNSSRPSNYLPFSYITQNNIIKTKNPWKRFKGANTAWGDISTAWPAETKKWGFVKGPSLFTKSPQSRHPLLATRHGVSPRWSNFKNQNWIQEGCSLLGQARGSRHLDLTNIPFSRV